LLYLKTIWCVFFFVYANGFLEFFVGEYNLLSTSATKVYFNLKISEIARVLDKYNYFLLRKWKLTLFFFFLKWIGWTMSRYRKLKNWRLIYHQWYQTKNLILQEILITCLCKVSRIDNKFGWYYIGCLTCKTKVKLIEGSY
jgi:hypothetical protein